MSNSSTPRATRDIRSTRLGSVVAGAAFRSAMLFLVLFVAVFVVAGAVILTTTEASMQSELESQITENINLMRDTQAKEGWNELIRFVNEATPPRAPRHYMFGLFTKTGEHLAGDLLRLPGFREWGRIETPSGPGGADYLAYVAEIGNAYIVSAGSLSFMNVAVTALWRALLLSGLLVAAGALVIGYVFSLGASAKLNAMAATLDQVSRGDNAVRLPIGRSNDQIDRIATQINAHLDRLSDLMGNLRRTATAIAHDLKSPLSRSYILLQEAAMTDDAERSAELVENAQAEIEQLGGIVDTVLRISRIEASDDRARFTTFSADSLVSDIAQTFAPVVEAEGCTLDYAVSRGSAAPIYGDRQMLQQLLANLIENATRYCPRGSTITLSAVEEAGLVVLAVADNGPGISLDRREDVLQPFYQLSPERDSRGSGLGLALVEAIATRHHATLQLTDNAPGLKVVVTFPRPDTLH